VFPIAIPPLRERVEDIPPRLDLQRYPWPGNVRELRNVIERAMILATSCTLTPDVPCVPSVPSSLPSTRLVDVQTRHMTSVLESCGWRVRGINGAATMLDTRMVRLGISRPGQ
jgi:formate hydrogenlyase transcriptional activator